MSVHTIFISNRRVVDILAPFQFSQVDILAPSPQDFLHYMYGEYFFPQEILTLLLCSIEVTNSFLEDFIFSRNKR